MKNHILPVCVAIAALMASVAQADLMLTVNGMNTREVPAIIQGMGPFVVVVEGNTPVGPNEVSLTVTGGTLQPLPDTNNTFNFEFGAEPTLGQILLIANRDLIIEDRAVAAQGTICGLYLFYNADANIVTALCVIPSEVVPQQEATEQASATAAVEKSAQAEPAANIDYNYVPLEGPASRYNWVLLHCPNSVGEITPPCPARAETQSGEGGGYLMLDGTIEVDSNITTNQIWTANNVYHVMADINVQALLVIEPGTIVQFASGTTMAVNNGGTLLSCGTPDSPVIYTSDAAEPWYSDYNCPIYIEETASASTKVTYSYIRYAYTGITVINNRLDSPIENNYLFNNTLGIVEYGTKHTDILNNLIYATYGYGIEVNMASCTNEGDANSHILIQNNTCDYYQDVGILVLGVENEADTGQVTLVNNIVSGAYQCGLVLANGWVMAAVLHTGYYDNYLNTWDDYNEVNPVVVTQWPYATGAGTLPVCYLNQDCDFINAGFEYIEETTLIGKTTDVNSFPDSNKTDIGFHYPNWNFSNPGNGDSLSADLDDSMRVDFKDFTVFANYWHQSTSAEADLDGSGFVDFNDLIILATQWLKLADPNIQIQIIGDSNDGYVDVGIAGFTSDTVSVFLLLDGEYVDAMILFDGGQTFYLDISALGSGAHELKAVSIDGNGSIVCSNITEASFSCSFRYCPAVGSYDLNEPYHFSAYYPAAGNVTVKVYDEDNNPVWSQTYAAQNLNGFIPSTITSRDDLDAITFEPPSGGGTAVTKPLALLFNPKKVPANIRALYISPDIWIHEFANGNVESGVKQAFKAHDVNYYPLELSSATYENLAWFAANRNIDYIYFAGHGNFTKDPQKPTFLRTSIGLWDGPVFSAKKSDFEPNTAPPWCQELPGSLEQTTNSICRLGFSSGRPRFVHFDCCWTGHLRLTSDNRLVEGDPGQQGLGQIPDSDMSWAFGMNGGYDQFYQGWWHEAEKGYTTPINTFSVKEWEYLRAGEDLYQALYDTVQYMATKPNGELATENFRVYGRGWPFAVRIE